MMHKKSWILILFLGLVTLASAIYYFPILPDQIPTHWNLSGEINKYSDKWMIFVLALLPIMIYALMGIMPKIDPKRASYSKHKKAYLTVRVALFLFLTALYVVVLLVALGYLIKIDMVIKLGIGILFIIIGNVLSQARHNYFFGIRTPWTLASEKVWNKTHRIGAYSFVILGFITCILSFVSGPISGYIIFASIMIAVIYPTIYSYLQYKKIKKKK